MDYMSRGLIVSIPPALKGTPSTTYRGSDDALIDRLARIRIDPTVPGRSLEVISTPAALPCKDVYKRQNPYFV